MATILAHIKVKPGKEQAFEGIVRALFAQSHANEEALLRYEYWRGQEPGQYYTLLSFFDYNGFLAHQTSPHHEAALGGLTETIADIRLEWLDPVAHASPLPETARQALAEDASALAKSYAKMFPLALAGWWAALK